MSDSNHWCNLTLFPLHPNLFLDQFQGRQQPKMPQSSRLTPKISSFFSPKNQYKQIYMDRQVQQTPYLSEHLYQEDHQTQIRCSAESLVWAIVDDIIGRVEKNIKENDVVKKYLKHFSNGQTIKDMNEVNNLFFKMGGNTDKKDREEQEPKPLLVDSLLPISADIDAENPYKKSQGKLNGTQDSSVRFKMTRPAFTEREDKYRKLQLTQNNEEDAMIKEMRRISQQNRVKQNDDKQSRQKLQKLKMLKKGGKEEKIGYDYNGKTIEIKTQNKKNLISALIDGSTHFKTEIVKEALNDPNPITLEGLSPSKGKIKKLDIPTQVSKRKDEIEFSSIRTLADHYKTTYGVKYTYEGKTYEEKKRVEATNDLKRTLSQRKLSKQEFAMLKKMNSNNREQFEDSLKKSTLKSVSEIKHLRTQSEMKLSEVKPKRNFETIHVSNSNLKAKLIEKVIKIQEPPSEKIEHEEENSSKIKLGTIDSFNLEYIKSGGALKSSTSRESLDRRSQLPKIAHTTLYSHTKPKGRERLKDSNQILRDLRKRFQQKLRV